MAEFSKVCETSRYSIDWLVYRLIVDCRCGLVGKDGNRYSIAEREGGKELAWDTVKEAEREGGKEWDTEGGREGGREGMGYGRRQRGREGG